MAHLQQQIFCLSVKKKFPDMFQGKLVLDIGSLDINGNNQYLFEQCGYLGVDLSIGNNVDIVSKGHELQFRDETFDVIISTECFEHDTFYAKTLQNIYRMLKSGGVFVFSCATTGRPEHGTRRTTPQDSPFTQDFADWSDYYQNLEEKDIRQVMDVDVLFQEYEFSVEMSTFDLYFWGMKKGALNHRQNYSFMLPSSYTSRTIQQLTIEHEEKIDQLTIEHEEKIDQLTIEHEEKIDQLTIEHENKFKELQSQRDSATDQVKQMQASSSWQLTSPLRFIMILLRLDFQLATSMLCHKLSPLKKHIPLKQKIYLKRIRDQIRTQFRNLPYSTDNFKAFLALTEERKHFFNKNQKIDPQRPPVPEHWPKVDISVVTFNSQRWIDGFLESLLKLDYPKNKLMVYFVDNGSTDETVSALNKAIEHLEAQGIHAEVICRPNRGFGAGHNAAIQRGNAEFCLVTNIDLTFETNSLSHVVASAVADQENYVAWELRQKPYEHPKYYEPITGTTNWNSHACILMRRSALKKVGGYDETLFMYGEDVELSYRFRQAGYLLRYCPNAVVWHYTYEAAGEVKPLQYVGSIFASLYLRLKYGNKSDMLAVITMSFSALFAKQVFPDSRRLIFMKIMKLLLNLPKALLSRKKTSAFFPFYHWEFDYHRLGAYVEGLPIPTEQALVSIITRTYKGRDYLLKQALFSAAHQTWDNLELVVVEDGTETLGELIQEVAQVTQRPIKYVINHDRGRSNAGNLGLSTATGDWCVFLDDDDLLYPEHVEVLANALLKNSHAAASYSPALEVSTKYANNEYQETGYTLHPFLLKDFSYETLTSHNLMAIQSVLFKRQLFLDRGGFDTEVDYLEDWLLWLRYAFKNTFIFVPKLTSLFRVPADPQLWDKRKQSLDGALESVVIKNQQWLESQEG